MGVSLPAQMIFILSVFTYSNFSLGEFTILPFFSDGMKVETDMFPVDYPEREKSVNGMEETTLTGGNNIFLISSSNKNVLLVLRMLNAPHDKPRCPRRRGAPSVQGDVPSSTPWIGGGARFSQHRFCCPYTTATCHMVAAD